MGEPSGLRPGTIVEGTVTQSYEYGLSIDIGLVRDAFCDNWDVYDKDWARPDPRRWGPPSHPPSGTKLRAVIVYHDDQRTRVSICPSDLAAAEQGFGAVKAWWRSRRGHDDWLRSKGIDPQLPHLGVKLYVLGNSPGLNLPTAFLSTPPTEDLEAFCRRLSNHPDLQIAARAKVVLRRIRDG